MHLLIEFIEKYGLAAIFLSVLVEGLGLPLPAYPVLMVAAALSAKYNFQISQIIAVGVSASLIADAVWLWGGRRFGMKIIGLLCKVSLSPDSCVRHTGIIFARIGVRALSFTKFIPGIGMITIVLAGITKASLGSVILFDAVGTFAYIGGAVLLGVIFRDAIDATLAVLARWGDISLLLVAVVLTAYITFKWWQRWSFARQLRMNRITVSELRVLLDGDKAPIILDARNTMARELQGIIPQSVQVDLLELGPIAAQYPKDAEVIVYCSCPNEASAALVANQLKKTGFKKIRPLLGGIEAWADAGYLVETAITT